MIRSSSSNCNNTNNKNNNNNKRGNSALVIFSDSNSVRFTLVNSQNYQIFSFLFRSHISVKAASLTKQRGKNLFRNTNCWLFTVKCENYWYNKIPLNCKLNGWRQCWFDRADWITWHCLGGSWHFTSNHLPLCPSLLDPPTSPVFQYISHWGCWRLDIAIRRKQIIPDIRICSLWSKRIITSAHRSNRYFPRLTLSLLEHNPLIEQCLRTFSKELNTMHPTFKLSKSHQLAAPVCHVMYCRW